MTSGIAVLALVTEAFGGRGGIAQYNRDFLGALAASGAASSLTVFPRHAVDDVAPPPGITQLRARPGRVAYSVSALAHAMRMPVDIVFCGHLFMAPLAAFIAHIKRAKFIVQTHGIEAWPQPARREREAAETADLILCVSRHTRARVLGWCAIAPERVLVLPDTVGEAFVPGDSALRSELGLTGKRVLLTVGRLDPRERYKGHDRVISALPQLVAGGFDVAYVIVGDGGDRPRLEAMAKKEGVSNRVRFIGAAAPETLVAAYRMADLFVMPSTGEGFGIAFLEAMACGTPALGLAAGGAPDALADGELGLLSNEDMFPTAIAQALSGQPPGRSALSAAVRARFGHKIFQAHADEILRDLLTAA